MLSSVLRSKQAVQVNVAIMRAFVRLRETLYLHKELASKLAELERRIEGHDTAIRSLSGPYLKPSGSSWPLMRPRPNPKSASMSRKMPSLTASPRAVKTHREPLSKKLRTLSSTNG
jgi:hypothetical protein